MATSNRQAKITPEHIEEARALRAIWDRTADERAARGEKSQEAFGDKYKIGNQSAVGFFLHGKTPLSLKAAKGFAAGLRCAVADFSPRLAAILETPPLSEAEAELLNRMRALAPADQATLLRVADALVKPALSEPAESPVPGHAPIAPPPGGQ